jgi:HD superfamily phosphohydrolase
MPKQQRIRDPLHDLIVFNVENQLEDVLWRVVQTRPFQRLRRIKQLGFSDFVYPGATHSRLVHSVGVFFTARRLMSVIQKFVPAKGTKVDQALAAALLHDLGHGPFSHSFEPLGDRFNLKMAKHEEVSDLLIRNSEVSEILREMGSGFATDVADIVSGAGTHTIYSAVVSSQFDADRLDYMRCDRLMTGTQHGAIDFEWLIENLEIGDVPHGVDQTSLQPVQTFVLGRKAIFAAEAYVLGLFQLYPTVYFHKATRGAEKICAGLLARVIQLIQDDAVHRTGLPNNHPLVKFALNTNSLDAALGLDDTVVWGALDLMVDSGDGWVSNFARRLRDRKLYKCIDVRLYIAHEKTDTAAMSPEADKVCTAVREELEECLQQWSAENPESAPRILIDAASRSPYNPITESKGPLNQINIRSEGNRLVDLAARSKVVAELETFKAFRVYHADGDNDAKRKITQVLEARIQQWPA